MTQIKNKHTPIEEYCVNGKSFSVKREDLFKAYPYPALAKLRGVCDLVKHLKAQGIKKLGAFDTRVSHAGWGLSAACQENGIECHVYFPYLKAQKELAPQQKESKKLGAHLHKLKGGRTAVLYSQAKKHAIENDIHMLPLGLVCKETVINVKNEALSVSRKYNTIVISTGTGTILSGVLLAYKNVKQVYGVNIETRPIKIHAVSAGMSEVKQRKRIMKLWKEVKEISNFDNVEFHISEKDYYTPEECDCPFPCHEYYDRKAYKWMIDNYNKLKQPLLFWNIGA